ncbi:cupin domain-containing protein [Actinoplanes sp. DH11]|uniref:cupin domain-containing protein n=1 Tax=Actinoplanes sp. DH11 TaxID=2857011 RepID=UPI001E34A719|nr:cupin domain-containing protein [Actinoplanes sp. DH11]
MTALSRVVALDPAAFAGTVWGREPRLTRAADLGGPGGFTGLLSPADIDELLSRRGLRTPFLRVADQGKVLPANRFAGGGGAGAEVADQVRDEDVMRLYAEGATLVLQGLHRLWPPLIGFAGELGAELNRPLQVNAYLTPPASQGFSTHYDTHDVFVLQVDGTKQWCVHPPVLPDPLEKQAWGGRADEVAATAQGVPALDVVLEPGDALYLPRGWLHSARAHGERSLHLTIGVRGPTRHTLVEELLTLAANDPRLRATLPYGLDVTDPDALEPELAATVAALRDWLSTADPAAVAARLRERTRPDTRPAPISPLAQLDFAAALRGSDRIVARPGLRRWWTADGELRAGGRAVRFPGYCVPAVRLALDGEPHTVDELPLNDPEDRLVLARRLLTEAIVVPAEGIDGRSAGIDPA